MRELVAKVILPVIEAGWGTGGNEIANKVRRVLCLLDDWNVS